MRAPDTGPAGRKPGRAFLVVAVTVLITVASAQAASFDAAPGATVDELLALARRLNPELAAAALESEQAMAKIVPAGALDDPMVNFTRDQGFRQTLVTVSQEFPLWGKRDLRREAARADAAAARGREAQSVQELAERVKADFAQYYRLHRAISTTHDIHALLHALAGTVRARYAQGLGNQSDALRADLAQTRLDPQLSALERDELMVKARLNALIARPADAPLAEPRELRAVPTAAALHLDELMGRARDRNPALAAARAEIAAAESERRLVDKSWYPDVTVSVGADELPRMSPQVVAGVGIKVPFQWGVREARAHEATAKKGAAQSRLEAARLKIESELASSLASLGQAQRTRDLLRSSLSPQSEAAYRSALASYERGRGDLTAVLDAAHQRLEIRLELLSVEAEEQTAFAAIERLVGEDL